MIPVADLLDLKGRIALVSGASRGIGAATARLLANAGAHVVLLARSRDRLEQVVSTLPAGQGMAVVTDLARDDDVRRAVDAAATRWGPVDILVNNAGEITSARYRDIDLNSWQRMLDVNLTGVFRLVRRVAPGMEEAGWGRIVTITSVSAQTGGVSGGAHYAASKGGLASLTKTLARDLAPAGVTVNAIAPGQIDTSPDLLTDDQRAVVTRMIPLGRLGQPEEVAHAVLFLASAMGSYITGATIDVNGGILKR